MTEGTAEPFKNQVVMSVLRWLGQQGVSTVLLIGLSAWTIYEKQYVEPAREAAIHAHCEKVHKIYSESNIVAAQAIAAAIENQTREIKAISAASDQASHRDFEVIRELLKAIGISVDLPRRTGP